MMFWKNNQGQICGNNVHPIFVKWLQLFSLILLLLTIASCGETNATGVLQQTIPSDSNSDDSLEKNETEAAVTSADDQSPQFVEQGLDQLESPFTKETVLALNAIVSRSLSAIESFDKARRSFDKAKRELDANSDATVTESLKLYARLSEEAKQAKTDMDSASERLRNSGEKYNKAIFAAMVRFVDNVDNEIRDEIDALSASNSPHVRMQKLQSDSQQD